MASLKKQIKHPSTRSKKLKESEGHSLLLKKEKVKSGQTKIYSLEYVKNKFIGKRGTAKREVYESELRLDLLGESIRQARIKQNLTQEQLGYLIGVQKAQISKIENNFTDSRISTILKVFEALQKKILLRIE